MITYIYICYVRPNRFSSFSNIYVMFGTYRKNSRWHYLLFIFCHPHSGWEILTFLVLLLGWYFGDFIFVCVIWKMIENFDHDHIKN